MRLIITILFIIFATTSAIASHCLDLTGIYKTDQSVRLMPNKHVPVCASAPEPGLPTWKILEQSKCESMRLNTLYKLENGELCRAPQSLEFIADGKEHSLPNGRAYIYLIDSASHSFLLEAGGFFVSTTHLMLDEQKNLKWNTRYHGDHGTDSSGVLVRTDLPTTTSTQN